MRRFRFLLLLAAFLVVVVAAMPAAAARPHVRVVGGQAVAMTDMPWVVYLEAGTSDANGWSCGGTIVGAHFVLTAAHCVVDKTQTIKPSQISGVAGRADLRTKDGTEFDVIRIAVNPAYNRTRGTEGGPGDAALLWTSVDLPYTTAVGDDRRCPVVRGRCVCADCGLGVDLLGWCLHRCAALGASPDRVRSRVRSE